MADRQAKSNGVERCSASVANGGCARHDMVMRVLVNLLRLTLAALCLFLGAVLVWAAVDGLTGHDERRAEAAAELARYRAASAYSQAYRTEHGNWPTDKQLRDWAAGRGFDNVWTDFGATRPGGRSVACSAAQPEFGFENTAGDAFILHRWRGEWFDCYGVPSGNNNVAVPDTPNRENAMILIAIACLLFGCAWLAWPWALRRSSV